MKNKQATIDSKNLDGKCFQYAITVALNYQKLNNHPEIITKIIRYIKQYDWNGIEFPSHKNDCNKFEKIIKQLLLMCYLFFTILNK